MRHSGRLVVVCGVVAAMAGGARGQLPANVVVVRQGAAPGGDGRSWVTAFRTVAEAFQAMGASAGQINETWISGSPALGPLASGGCVPTAISQTSPPNVTIRGGFAGSEQDSSQRPVGLRSRIDLQRSNLTFSATSLVDRIVFFSTESDLCEASTTLRVLGTIVDSEAVICNLDIDTARRCTLATSNTGRQRPSARISFAEDSAISASSPLDESYSPNAQYFIFGRFVNCVVSTRVRDSTQTSLWGGVYYHCIVSSEVIKGGTFVNCRITSSNMRSGAQIVQSVVRPKPPFVVVAMSGSSVVQSDVAILDNSGNLFVNSIVRGFAPSSPGASIARYSTISQELAASITGEGVIVAPGGVGGTAADWPPEATWVDLGNNNVVPSSGLADINGRARFFGAATPSGGLGPAPRVDRGPVEVQPAGAPPFCYANMDGSSAVVSGTTVPTLTMDDFAAFLALYRAGHRLAYCDANDELSPSDFTCFLAKFRAGCGPQ